jgi:hypothetical protein
MPTHTSDIYQTITIQIDSSVEIGALDLRSAQEA